MILYDNINKDTTILMQTWTIFILIRFILFYLHHFENYGSWTVYQNGKWKLVNGLALFYS